MEVSEDGYPHQGTSAPKGSNQLNCSALPNTSHLLSEPRFGVLDPVIEVNEDIESTSSEDDHSIFSANKQVRFPHSALGFKPMEAAKA